jgi:creatinine amidohydrolase
MAATTHTLPLWADLCTTDFATLDPARTVAVLPVAATEQHGPHLPLSVDSDLVEGILRAAALHVPHGCPCYVLPTQAIGLSPEHQRFPGTLTLRPETLIQLWLDIGTSVARAGVRKLVLFNSHGGHTGIMDVVARELRSRLDLLVYSISWFNLPLLDEQGQDLNTRFSAEEHRFGIHAGQIETSMMLALKLDRVRMQHARHFPSTSQARARQYPMLGNGRSAKLAWQMQDYHPQGAVGNAAAADALTGQALVNAAGRALAQALQEVVDLSLSTLVDRPGQA